LRGPPGLGGESRGFSPVGNQSFFTGGGSDVVNVAIVTSPKGKTLKLLFKNQISTKLTDNSQSFLACVIHSKHFFAFCCFLGTFFHHL
jgi:hypothetical protein